MIWGSGLAMARREQDLLPPLWCSDYPLAFAACTPRTVRYRRAARPRVPYYTYDLQEHAPVAEVPRALLLLYLVSTPLL